MDNEGLIGCSSVIVGCQSKTTTIIFFVSIDVIMQVTIVMAHTITQLRFGYLGKNQMINVSEFDIVNIIGGLNFEYIFYVSSPNA